MKKLLLTVLPLFPLTAQASLSTINGNTALILAVLFFVVVVPISLLSNKSQDGRKEAQRRLAEEKQTDEHTARIVRKVEEERRIVKEERRMFKQMEKIEAKARKDKATGATKEDIHDGKEISADEQFKMALNYEFGQFGSVQDISKAIDLYSKAANRGLAKAQHNLALLYEGGKGVSRDKQKAIIWYTKAAEQGVSLSQFNLAQLYSSKSIRDFDLAIKWYERCKDSDFMGKFQLGLLVHMGIGTKQDKSRGLRLLKEAAAEGDHETKAKLKAYLSKVKNDDR